MSVFPHRLQGCVIFLELSFVNVSVDVPFAVEFVAVCLLLDVKRLLRVLIRLLVRCFESLFFCLMSISPCVCLLIP